MVSPSATPAAALFAALMPIKHFPRISAIRVRQVCPLMVTEIGGLAPPPMASMAALGISTAVALPDGMTLVLSFMSRAVSGCAI